MELGRVRVIGRQLYCSTTIKMAKICLYLSSCDCPECIYQFQFGFQVWSLLYIAECLLNHFCYSLKGHFITNLTLLAGEQRYSHLLVRLPKLLRQNLHGPFNGFIWEGKVLGTKTTPEKRSYIIRKEQRADQLSQNKLVVAYNRFSHFIKIVKSKSWTSLI